MKDKAYILPIVLLIMGCSLISYPLISNWPVEYLIADAIILTYFLIKRKK